MRRFKFVVTVAAALSLGACAQDHQNEDAGTLLGAAAGALLGSQLGHGDGQGLAMGVGMIAGAWLGNQWGKSLDAADRAAMQRSTQTALNSAPSGRTIRWNNPDSGHSGSITPQPPFTNPQGRYCREYQQTVTIGGKNETAYGTACRQPDGSWRIASNG